MKNYFECTECPKAKCTVLVDADIIPKSCNYGLYMSSIWKKKDLIILSDIQEKAIRETFAIASAPQEAIDKAILVIVAKITIATSMG